MKATHKKTIDRTKSPAAEALPLRRDAGLIIQEVENELLIYDEETDKSHCLNWTAAVIWELCDGQTSTSEMSRILSRALTVPVSEEMVRFGVGELARNHLLDKRAKLPNEVITEMKRREIIRSLGLATIAALPLITSIVAPTPAQAATCLPSGATCQSSAQCCAPGICQGNGTCL